MLTKLTAFVLVALLHIAALLGLGLLSATPKVPELPTSLPTLQAVWIDPNPPVAARAAEQPQEQPRQTEPTPPVPPKKPPVKKVHKPKIVASHPDEPQEKPEAPKPEPTPQPQQPVAPATSTANHTATASGGVVGGTGKAEQGAAIGTDDGGGAPAVELPSSNASYLNNPKPVYPPLSRRRNEAGTVYVRVHVQADGSASNVRLHKSSGFPALDQSALEAVAQWRFVPGKRNGKPVAMEHNVPVRFRLTD